MRAEPATAENSNMRKATLHSKNPKGQEFKIPLTTVDTKMRGTKNQGNWMKVYKSSNLPGPLPHATQTGDYSSPIPGEVIYLVKMAK